MSNSMNAVLDGPRLEATDEWVELDGGLDVATPRPLASDLIELELPIGHPSQHAMRFGPRAYTQRQAEVIDLTVRKRRPLRAPPLPLDD